jgi:hypothetical protein
MLVPLLVKISSLTATLDRITPSNHLPQPVSPPGYTMKLTTIIATVIAFGAAAAVPVELHERQCTLNGCESTCMPAYVLMS